MATSLISSGVQFPDSSIQTTAATGGTMQFIASIQGVNTLTYDFSNNISTTYNHYKLVFSNYRCSGSGGGATIQLFSTADSWITSSYGGVNFGNYFNSGSLTDNLASYSSALTGMLIPGYNSQTISGYIDIIGINYPPSLGSPVNPRYIGFFVTSAISSANFWYNVYGYAPLRNDYTGLRIQSPFNTDINHGRVDLYGIKTS